jgi:hypothetical protein
VNNPGDKCPQCKEGLLVRTELGIACDTCSYELEIGEVVEMASIAKKQQGTFKWKAKTFKITLDEPEEAEQFLRGCILARQNVNCEVFQDLIDVTNQILEPWRAARMNEELRARDAGM